MRQTEFFNINVPELGDTPDITQVSDAISNLEDTIAGSIEFMNAAIQGQVLTLTSGTRTIKRTKYYDGMSFKFTAPAQINPNGITSVVVDNLNAQPATFSFPINSGDTVEISYKTNKFEAKYGVVNKSNSIDSNSTNTVATSNAVKQLNDIKYDKSQVDDMLSYKQDKIDDRLQTAEKNVVDSINGLFNSRWQIINKRIFIGSNLNDFRVAGFYYCYENANNVLNTPNGNQYAFIMEVKYLNSEVYASQELRFYNDNKIFTRFTLNNGETWTAWVANITSAGGTFDGVVYSSNGYILESKLSGCSIYSDNSSFGFLRQNGNWVMKYDKDSGVCNFDKTPTVAGSNTMLHTGNFGKVVDVLMDGYLDKNYWVNFAKNIDNYDLIQIITGDAGGGHTPPLPTPGGGGKDIGNIIMRPQDLKGNRISVMYPDANGANTNNLVIDTLYFDVGADGSNMRFMYNYQGGNYEPNATVAPIKVVGYKWGLK